MKLPLSIKDIDTPIDGFYGFITLIDADGNGVAIGPQSELECLANAVNREQQLIEALDELVTLIPGAAEYGDWPQLQSAVEKSRSALSLYRDEK